MMQSDQLIEVPEGIEVELWECVLGDVYAVSNRGRVMRTYGKRSDTGCGCVISQRISPRGYCRVNVSPDGSRKTRRSIHVHTLVAEAFLGERGNRDVNHKDGNKLNNTPANLEYVTRSENTIHAWKNGLTGNTRLPDDAVRDIRSRRRNGESVPAIARQYGCHESTVYSIANKLRRANVADIYLEP